MKPTNHSAPPKILAIVGPTASGKSQCALEAAEDLGGEIISADSIQIYKHLNIGSAKPSLANRKRVKHYLVDELELDAPYNSAIFKRMAEDAILKISKKNKLPIICGSAMLYIKSLVYGLADIPPISTAIKELVEKTWAEKGNAYCLSWLKDLTAKNDFRFSDPQRVKRALAVILQTGRSITDYQHSHGFSRPEWPCFFIQLRLPRALLYQKIDQRVDNMVAQGLLAEVAALLKGAVDPNIKPLQAIGYRQAVSHLAGKMTLAEMIAEIKQKTRHYAKRQLTWYRNNHTNKIQCCCWSKEAKKQVEKFLAESLAVMPAARTLRNNATDAKPVATNND